VPDDATARCPSLEAGNEEAVHVQQGSLLLADLAAFGEQHGDVIKVPQLRGAGEPLQAVEGKTNVLVFQGGVEEEGCPSLQDGRGEDGVLLDLPGRVAGENRVNSPPPDPVSRLDE
jgi:hypothetical protein